MVSVKTSVLVLALSVAIMLQLSEAAPRTPSLERDELTQLIDRLAELKLQQLLALGEGGDGDDMDGSYQAKQRPSNNYMEILNRLKGVDKRISPFKQVAMGFGKK